MVGLAKDNNIKYDIYSDRPENREILAESVIPFAKAWLNENNEFKAYINIAKKHMILDYTNIMRKNLIKEFYNLIKYNYTFLDMLKFFKLHNIQLNKIIDDETYKSLDLSSINQLDDNILIEYKPFINITKKFINIDTRI